jgi:hypothetical protein
MRFLGGSPLFSSETLRESREPPSPSHPQRSHMEPEFFQHGGKGNRHVWLGRAAPHPLFSGSQISDPPWHLSSSHGPVSQASARSSSEPGWAKSRCRVAKAPFNSVTSSAQTCCRGAGRRPGVLGTCRR